MKFKSLLIVLLSGVCLFSAQAQWRLGAEVGIDLSSVNNPANHTQIGEHGGLTVDYAFKNKINLASGIYYTMKGANSIRVNSYDLLARLGYLEIPVMVGYRIPVAPDIHLIPAVGAYFAWGVNGNGELTSAGNPETSLIE